jgi:hypothetical protein
MAQDIATGKYKCCGVNFKNGPPTVAEWKRHLAGKSGIGVTAVRKDGRTKFGSIDLDTHGKNACGFSCIDVADKIKSQKLPLILIKSKGGGLLLTVFFTEPVDAAMVRRVLRAWAISLGFPNAEVFPKQDAPNKDDNGSNLWMPYFGCFKNDSSLPQQAGTNLTGGAMDIGMFVTVAEQSAISFKQFAELAPPPTEEPWQQSKAKGSDKHPKAMSRRQAQNYLQEACEEIPKLQPGELNNGVVELCHIPGRAVGGRLLNDDTWDKQLEPAIKRNPHH